MRILKWVAGAAVGVVALIALSLVGWNVVDRGPPVAEATANAEGFDLSKLLVLVDADMAATGYADGQLHPIDSASDALMVLDAPGSTDPDRRSAGASNTVMGWPGAMTADREGRFAYVVEGRAPPPEGTEVFENVFAEMPEGRLLTTIDLRSGNVVVMLPVCRRPNSIDISPDATWLLIACGDDGGELAVVPLQNGKPGEPRLFDLELPNLSERPGIDDGLSYAMIHPDGVAAGAIQSNLGVGLVRFTLDGDGVPIEADAEPVRRVGDWLTIGRWTKSGNHFLVADVEWGPTPLGAVFLADGEVLSVALSPGGDTRGVVSSARVSKSPEAFELNRAGDLMAVVNMERTYLPGGLLSVVPRRNASSLSLVRVDDATGTLETLGEPVGFRGVLPEDAVFDRDGDSLAVVVYQDHDAPRSEGWVEIFDVNGEEIVPTGRRIAMPRGAHDLFAID